MWRRLRRAGFALMLFAMTAGVTAEPDCAPVVRIMPLGDSITKRPGYRPGLQKSLRAARINADFVGSNMNACAPRCGYDPDHEGHSGWTPAEISQSVSQWLIDYEPDVILLHIGTNDLDVDTVANILSKIHAHNKNIITVVGLIINRQRFHQPTHDFNEAVRRMAQARIAAGERIRIVDHESALSYPDDMEDALHPNTSGFKKMEKVWLAALTELLPACPPKPSILDRLWQRERQ